MNTDELLKKLKDIKASAYNNVHSSEEESPLQVYDGTWGRLPVDEDSKGEDVKIERTKGEDYKLPETLSRTTPMDKETQLKDWWFAEMEHAKNELKQLEDMLANVGNPNYKPFGKNDPMAQAQMILEEGPKNDKEAEIHLMLRDAHAKGDANAVRQHLAMLPQGM